MNPEIYTEHASPPRGEPVARFDHCPGFEGRQSLLAIEPICWFCRFAVFDLLSDKLPNHGVCRYPMESRGQGRQE